MSTEGNRRTSITITSGPNNTNEVNRALLGELKKAGVQFRAADRHYVMDGRDLTSPMTQQLLLHTHSSLSLVRALVHYFPPSDITVEPGHRQNRSGDTDVRIEADGGLILIQLKSVNSFAKDNFKDLRRSTKDFDKRHHSEKGCFFVNMWTLDKSGERWTCQTRKSQVNTSCPFVAVHHWSLQNQRDRVVSETSNKLQKAIHQLEKVEEGSTDTYRVPCLDVRFEAIDEDQLRGVAARFFDSGKHKTISGMLFLKDVPVPEEYVMVPRFLPLNNETSVMPLSSLSWYRGLKEELGRLGQVRVSSFFISSDVKGSHLSYAFTRGFKLVLNDTYEYGDISWASNTGGQAEGIGVKGLLYD
ncbi:MAG: hypothetical protein JRN35_07430 [Nitrososphaerota archaeon]|nr:hypothetical protein [Nitrososphaerota archaeon]